MDVMSHHSLHLMDCLMFWVCCIGLKLPPKNNCSQNVSFPDHFQWNSLSMMASFQQILIISTYHMLRAVWLSISDHWLPWIMALSMEIMTKRRAGGKRHSNFHCVLPRNLSMLKRKQMLRFVFMLLLWSENPLFSPNV